MQAYCNEPPKRRSGTAAPMTKQLYRCTGACGGVLPVSSFHNGTGRCCRECTKVRPNPATVLRSIAKHIRVATCSALPPPPRPWDRKKRHLAIPYAMPSSEAPWAICPRQDALPTLSQFNLASTPPCHNGAQYLSLPHQVCIQRHVHVCGAPSALRRSPHGFLGRGGRWMRRPFCAASHAESISRRV